MNIIRAWKDREYRESLSDEELALLPENPAGEIELNDDELTSIVGGGGGGGGSNCQVATVCNSAILCSIIC